MRIQLVAIALVFALSVLPSAHAVTASPFGVRIGGSTLANVRQVVGARTVLRPAGISVITHGPILASDGHGLGMPDVERVLFVFDRHDLLQVVEARLPNGGMGYPLFKRYRSLLAERYREVADREAFVGEQYARFVANNAVITLVSPQMSFNMDLIYASPEALQAERRYELVQRARKRAAQAHGL